MKKTIGSHQGPRDTTVERPRDTTVERTVEDLFLLETFLQWLQVHRQQCLNLKFARPMGFSEGELAALNRAIAKLDHLIQHRYDALTVIC